jgi:hypothetical protein
MKLEFTWQMLKNTQNTKIHENPSSDNWVFSCGWTDGQIYGQKDMMKLIVAFRNFANSHKN